MKPSTGVPVRIQKAGEVMPPCEHGTGASSASAPAAADPISKPVGGKSVSVMGATSSAKAVEPHVEIREIEPGIFEITMTCRCGEKAVVRCESLVAEPAKKSVEHPASS